MQIRTTDLLLWLSERGFERTAITNRRITSLILDGDPMQNLYFVKRQESNRFILHWASLRIVWP